MLLDKVAGDGKVAHVGVSLAQGYGLYRLFIRFGKIVLDLGVGRFELVVDEVVLRQGDSEPKEVFDGSDTRIISTAYDDGIDLDVGVGEVEELLAGFGDTCTGKHVELAIFGILQDFLPLVSCDVKLDSEAVLHDLDVV